MKHHKFPLNFGANGRMDEWTRFLSVGRRPKGRAQARVKASDQYKSSCEMESVSGRENGPFLMSRFMIFPSHSDKGEKEGERRNCKSK